MEKKKRNKRTINQTKGITLIALVITIIVLLILAGVSIAMLTGENGILSQASKAKDETEISGEKEAISLAYTGALTEKQGQGTVTASDMNSQFATNGTDATAKGSIDVKFNESGRIYKIDSQGKITGPFEEGEVPAEKTLADMFNQAIADTCTNEDGSCTREDHLHIGDYVDFKNPTTGKFDITSEMSGIEGTQTYSANNNQNLNWRVLGIENGEIKLIAGTPMKLDDISGKNDPYLYLNGAEAYEYGPDAMDNAVKTIYGSLEHVSNARSVNMQDIDQALEITSDEQRKQYNAMASSGVIQYQEPYGPFKNQYTPKGWLNGKQTETVQGNVSAYCYFIGNEEGMIQSANSKINKMLFDNVEYEKGKSYWLASRGAYAYADYSYAYFAPFAVYENEGMVYAGSGCTFDSNGGENVFCCAVRPVVSLESGVTSKDIPKVEDKKEETWNYDGGNWNAEV